MLSRDDTLKSRPSHSEIFFNLIDNAPFGVFVLDSHFRIFQVNRGAKKVFENVRPLIGRDFAEALRIVWPEPFASTAIAIFRHTLSTGEPYTSADTTETRRDKVETESYDWKVERITLPDGQYGVVCYFYDITERKRAQQVLLESEQRCQKFVFLAEQSMDFIGMCDMEFRPFYINTAGLTLVGLESAEESFRTHVSEFFFPEDQPYILNEFFPKVLKEGQGSVEVRFRHFKTGEGIWMLYNVSYIKDPQGQPVGLATISQNIAKRKQAEDDAQKYALDLQRSNRELQQFALIASHDLKEPLQLVSAYANILSKRYKAKLDDKANEFLKNILDTNGKMIRLTQDLLAYAKAGRTNKAFKPVDSRHLCAQAINNLQVRIESAGATINVGALPMVTADEVQLCQLFQNLIGNALKFRSETPPIITVEAQPDHEECIFSVRDNGIGIAPGDFDRIFELFSRGQSHGQYEGTGIGLAICKKVVDNHGGRIWVESEIGRGTTFYFAIPHRPGKAQ